jgi:hypothetical protein
LRYHLRPEEQLIATRMSDPLSFDHDKYLDYYDGTIHWYAVDRCGFLAHFETCGLGPVPVRLLDTSLEELRSLEEYFFDSAPVVGTSIVDRRITELTEGQSRPISEEAHLMAERGLFSWFPIRSPTRRTGYERLALPSVPLQIDNVPTEFRRVISICCFDIIFAERARLDFAEIRLCGIK